MPNVHADARVVLHHGDALQAARRMPTGSVQTIVTSPPYFGLRDYGEGGQVGAEATLAEYVERLVALFGELRRVLADDGTLWLNLGDSYSLGNGNVNQPPQTNSTVVDGLPARRPRGETGSDSRSSVSRTFRNMPPSKNLLGVPWRVAFALQADGWVLRSDIIWAKPNPMPESVRDRPTKAHEYLFLFAKRPRYYYDADAIAEDANPAYASRYESGFGGGKSEALAATGYGDTRPIGVREYTGKRNRRTVWTITPKPFKGAHFAVFPPELVRPCILAGSRPGDVVLDPFSGSGTTGMVAIEEGRRYVGVDLSAEYLALSLSTRLAAHVA